VGTGFPQKSDHVKESRARVRFNPIGMRSGDRRAHARPHRAAVSPRRGVRGHLRGGSSGQFAQDWNNGSKTRQRKSGYAALGCGSQIAMALRRDGIGAATMPARDASRQAPARRHPSAHFSPPPGTSSITPPLTDTGRARPTGLPPRRYHHGSEPPHSPVRMPAWPCLENPNGSAILDGS
jgi:hypothetical protein